MKIGVIHMSSKQREVPLKTFQINKGEHRSRNVKTQNILQAGTLEGMGQDTHT